MNPAQLTPGVYPVKITDQLGTVEFDLSVVSGIKRGQKPPAAGKHMMLSETIRNWIERIEAA